MDVYVYRLTCISVCFKVWILSEFYVSIKYTWLYMQLESK